MKIKVLSLIFLSSLFGTAITSEGNKDFDASRDPSKFDALYGSHAPQPRLLDGLMEDSTKPKDMPQTTVDILRKLTQQILEYDQRVSREAEESQKKIAELERELEQEREDHTRTLSSFDDRLQEMWATKKEEIFKLLTDTKTKQEEDIAKFEVSLVKDLEQAKAEKELAQAEREVAEAKLRREIKKFNLLLGMEIQSRKLAERKVAEVEQQLIKLENIRAQFQFELDGFLENANQGLITTVIADEETSEMLAEEELTQKIEPVAETKPLLISEEFSAPPPPEIETQSRHSSSKGATESEKLLLDGSPQIQTVSNGEGEKKAPANLAKQKHAHRESRSPSIVKKQQQFSQLLEISGSPTTLRNSDNYSELDSFTKQYQMSTYGVVDDSSS